MKFIETAFVVLLILVLIIGAVMLLCRKKKPDYTKMYIRKEILTDREYEFYIRLAPLADEFGLRIFTKVRFADLVEPKDREDMSLWWECFNKIKAKHIDFALADDDTNIIMLIELDDTTHNRPDRQERDAFVEAVLANTGYLLMRTYGELDEIEAALYELCGEE